jgi:hypothetical protein
MGQFDRVAFEQCGEDLFDSLFEFDRRLNDTMVYANIQKNGSLEDRLKIDTLVLETTFETKDNLVIALSEIEVAFVEPSLQIHFNIADDVDDESKYGRNRRRHKDRSQ